MRLQTVLSCQTENAHCVPDFFDPQSFPFPQCILSGNLYTLVFDNLSFAPTIRSHLRPRGHETVRICNGARMRVMASLSPLTYGMLAVVRHSGCDCGCANALGLILRVKKSLAMSNSVYTRLSSWSNAAAPPVTYPLRSASALTTERYALSGWFDSKLRYLPVCVGFRYTPVISLPSNR